MFISNILYYVSGSSLGALGWIAPLPLTVFDELRWPWLQTQDKTQDLGLTDGTQWHCPLGANGLTIRLMWHEFELGADLTNPNASVLYILLESCSKYSCSISGQSSLHPKHLIVKYTIDIIQVEHIHHCQLAYYVCYAQQLPSGVCQVSNWSI